MSLKSRGVSFSPLRVEVDGGTIYATTEIRIPETDKTNGVKYEISVFQCECGCPECISIVQTTTSKDDPEFTDVNLMTISPEDYNDFISGLKRSYEAIVSKNN